MKKLVIICLTALCLAGCGGSKTTEVSTAACKLTASGNNMSKTIEVVAEYTSKSATTLTKTEKIKLASSTLTEEYTKAYEIMANRYNSIGGVTFSYTIEGSMVESVMTIDLTVFDSDDIDNVEIMNEAMKSGKNYTAKNIVSYLSEFEGYTCDTIE